MQDCPAEPGGLSAQLPLPELMERLTIHDCEPLQPVEGVKATEQAANVPASGSTPQKAGKHGWRARLVERRRRAAARFIQESESAPASRHSDQMCLANAAEPSASPSKKAIRRRRKKEAKKVKREAKNELNKEEKKETRKEMKRQKKLMKASRRSKQDKNGGGETSVEEDQRLGRQRSPTHWKNLHDDSGYKATTGPLVSVGKRNGAKRGELSDEYGISKRRSRLLTREKKAISCIKKLSPVMQEIYESMMVEQMQHESTKASSNPLGRPDDSTAHAGEGKTNFYANEGQTIFKCFQEEWLVRKNEQTDLTTDSNEGAGSVKALAGEEVVSLLQEMRI